jgi:hypothetical protein
MVRRRTGVAISVMATVVACQSLLDFDNPGDDKTNDGGAVDATSEGASDAGVDGASAADAADGSANPVDAAGLCNGMTGHFPFDLTLDGGGGRKAYTKEDASFGVGYFDAGVVLEGNMRLIVDKSSKESDLHRVGSIAFWAYPTWSPPCSEPHLLFKLQSDGPFFNVGPDLGCAQFGPLRLRVIGPDAAIEAPAMEDAGFGPSKWTHVVATWDRAKPSLVLIINGERAAESTLPWPAPPLNETFEETMLGYIPQPLDGIMDDVSIWTRELSLDEARVLYSASSDLVAACLP